MSLSTLTSKLLDSIKSEIDKPENMNRLMNDILDPVVERVLQKLSSYFFGLICVFTFIVVAIFLILLMNVKICYFN